MRKLPEQAFEYRVQRILDDDGYVTINCARSKPFDLIAFKDGFVFVIEVKGRATKYPWEQQQRQKVLAEQAGVTFAVIRQSRSKGRMEIEYPVRRQVKDSLFLNRTFKKWLVKEEIQL